MSAQTVIPWSEIEKHVAAGDLWVIIDKKVYDVTRFADSHPGGTEVLQFFAGYDASDAHENFHPPSVDGVLSAFYIGDVDPKSQPPKNKVMADDPFTRDMRQLRTEMRREGLFDASMLYYAWKAVSTLAIYFGSLYLLLSGAESSTMFWISAILFGLSQQQFAYLSHDLVHHQVFKDRRIGDLIGFCFGTMCQSFSGVWWKWRHNLHHAATNADGYDKDIDTMPLLAWSTDLLPQTVKEYPLGSKMLLPNQVYLFLPLLCLARINWVVQSFLVSFTKMLNMRKVDMNQPGVAEYWSIWWRLPSSELAGMLFHWAYLTVFAVVACKLTILDFVYWASLSSAFAGFFLGSVFAISHNGMDVFTKENARLDYFRAQVVSSRNVNASLISDFYCGGLNYQIEHHLFPNLPRHRFGVVSQKVRALCAKHGVKYVSVGFWEGFFDLFAVLARVGRQAAADFAGKSRSMMKGAKGVVKAKATKTM